MIHENFRISDKILVIPGKKVTKGIPVDEIIAFERRPDGTFIYCITEENSELCKLSLDSLEKIFAPRGFYRIHRSYLINTRYFRGVDRSQGGIVTMFKGKTFEVARAKCRDFDEAMLKPYRDLMKNTTVRAPETTVHVNRVTVRGFCPHKP